MSCAVEFAHSLSIGSPHLRAQAKTLEFTEKAKKNQTGIITARLGRQRQRFDHGFARPDIGHERNPVGRSGVSVLSHERNPLARSGHALLSAQGPCRIGALRRCCASDYSSAHLSRAAIRPLSRCQEKNKQNCPASPTSAHRSSEPVEFRARKAMYRSMRSWGRPMHRSPIGLRAEVVFTSAS